MLLIIRIPLQQGLEAGMVGEGEQESADGGTPSSSDADRPGGGLGCPSPPLQGTIDLP
jgi:hypothetical protein